MKTVNLISTTILFLMLCFSVQGQNDWDGDNITGNDKASIGTADANNTNAKLMILNDDYTQSLLIKTISNKRYGINNKVYSNVATNSVFGIRSELASTTTGVQYGIYTKVFTSEVQGGITPSSGIFAGAKYGIYSEAEGYQNRAGYFKGTVETRGDVITGGTQGLFRISHSNTSSNNYWSLTPNTGGAGVYAWDENKSLVFNNNGMLSKNASNSDDVAFQVKLMEGLSNHFSSFRILGDGRTAIGDVDPTTMPTGYKLLVEDGISTGKIKIASSATIGDVSIANMPNDYKLYVRDGILTEKVKIALYATSQWADYVFDDNYRLMPLNELDTYLNQNKHLPNIPSSEELVEEGGVELMEITRLQMEKIEELTLYLIELNKKVEKLEKQLEASN